MSFSTRATSSSHAKNCITRLKFSFMQVYDKGGEKLDGFVQQFLNGHFSAGLSLDAKKDLEVVFELGNLRIIVGSDNGEFFLCAFFHVKAAVDGLRSSVAVNAGDMELCKLDFWWVIFFHDAGING